MGCTSFACACGGFLEIGLVAFLVTSVSTGFTCCYNYARRKRFETRYGGIDDTA